MRVLVAGAGGFIGGHLVRRLLDEGFQVRAVDIKPLHGENGEEGWWQIHPEAENIDGEVHGDLKEYPNCQRACDGMDHVYQLACRMGGIKEITENIFECSLNVLIDAHMLVASEACGVKRHFFSSSACAYPAGKQDRTDLPALKESDVYPAMPEAGYGWAKLYAELLCEYATAEDRVECRVARFHNSMGPRGSWRGGREKAPAAICRKVAEAKLGLGPPEITIWGDGTRTRSFMYIDDNIDGIRKIMDSDIRQPLNLGTSECVTINQLVDVVEEVAGIKLERHYDLTAPQGVHGRNSDNELIKLLLGWEPSLPLREGIAKTYPWVEDEVRKHGRCS
ncbi:MAG: NAD-dependent epimerase/dehydratase family protein [Planctomycetota bacterium]|jgi:nucleoside-diphosphate-sugar epimerase